VDWVGGEDALDSLVGQRARATARRRAAGAPRTELTVENGEYAVEYVAGRRWDIPVTSFWQAHTRAAGCYSELVAEWADPRSGATVWDLYSGAGVFAASLADQAGRVHAVESARPAVAAGRVALADAAQVEFHSQRVEQWLHGDLASRPEVVVLDPPRAGAGAEVVAAVTAATPDRIVHIGCDPASFARDISLYHAAGYRMKRLRAFDAFPNTHHVECLALLEH
jgi:tRNA/tmRNA/rRNA uracil-C5-methylase (TrmA/RlmC/RlmD family)